jgi:hypothetical protein
MEVVPQAPVGSRRCVVFGAYLGRFPTDLAGLWFVVFRLQMPFWFFYGLLLIGFIVAFSLLIATWQRLANFRCPRCGNAFRYHGGAPKWWALIGQSSRFRPLARKCQTCGLRKWSCEGCWSDTSLPMKP